MVGLGLLALTGRMWSMPSMLRAPDTTRGDSAAFFSLGVFSGIASSCCAPVLAGVMTLSALSGNPVGGLLLGLAFVFGMVIPLLVMALVWDVARLNERRWGSARPIRIRFADHTLHTNTVNVLVAVAFVVMGVWVITLAGSATMTGSGTWFQLAAGDWITQAAQAVLTWLGPVPEPVLGVALLAVAGAFVWATLRDRSQTDARVTPDGPAGAEPVPKCHGAHDDHSAARHEAARD